MGNEVGERKKEREGITRSLNHFGNFGQKCQKSAFEHIIGDIFLAKYKSNIVLRLNNDYILLSLSLSCIITCNFLISMKH